MGNQITRSNAGITYTAFDLPAVVTPPSGDPAIRFSYDGDHRRIRKESSAQETVYFEDMYERVASGASGGAVHRYYVGAGSATVVLTRLAGGTSKVAYLHADALRSTDVVTDGKGKVAGNAGERRSYDAFGARRSPLWGQAAPAGGFASKASPMGFTGHEGDDEPGLINMRGRMYDPRLGRFLSTDPIVSSRHFGQSWNPYSYVRNSPLNFTDPSGFAGVGTYENLGGVQGQFPVPDVSMLADPASGVAPQVKPPRRRATRGATRAARTRRPTTARPVCRRRWPRGHRSPRRPCPRCPSWSPIPHPRRPRPKVGTGDVASSSVCPAASRRAAGPSINWRWRRGS